MAQSKIVNAFFCPEFYDHPVDHIELVETHISWVFLTGSFAYKIKKPVNFGFLDFTTLEQREFFCHQELLLNSRFAPQVYLEVIPVTKSGNDLSLAGVGEVVDYAIKMNQFDHKCLFNKLVQNDQVELYHIDDLIDVVADFHNNINIAGADVNFGSTQEVIKPVEENFSILNNILSDSQFYNKDNKQILKSLLDLVMIMFEQAMAMFELIQAYLIDRKKQGHIRECHGDLHLGNITLIENKVVLFDGIEFNDSFRWIDTMSDCAFLIMDFQDHGQTVFANHFLNGYLLKTGDYSGLLVLKFYKLYRAMVRAKVAGLRLQQQKQKSTAYKNTLADLRNYLELAQRYLQTATQDQSQKNKTFLAISFGLSGSGKSWVCSQLADQLGAIQLCSDVERKRLFLHVVKDLYNESTTDKTYIHLMKTAEQILNAGYSVIVDATFLDKKWRQKFHAIAQRQQISFHIIACYADQKTLKQRLRARQNEMNSISDADIPVMKNQLKKMDQLGIEEKQYEISVDTVMVSDYSSIITQIQRN